MTISNIPTGYTVMGRRAGYDRCDTVHLSSTGESIQADAETGNVVVPIADVPALNTAGWAELPAIISMPPQPQPPEGPIS